MSRREWFRFVTNKATPDKAEIQIFGDIGSTYWGDGMSPQMFVDQLADIDDDAELDVRINSPGGSAWDGMTIANAIMRHPGKTTTWIDGLAASAASLVAVSGDEVVISKWGRAMLHNAQALVVGTADDMREVADQIDALNGTMAAYYADRAKDGDDAAAFARAMKKETWYNAEQFLAAGLATRIDDSGVRDEVEKAAAHALAGTAVIFKHTPAATTKETRMATKDDLAKRLGKDPADITDEDLYKAALEALGDKPADPPADPPPADKPAAPPAAADKPADPPAADKPAPVVAEGTVEVDAAAFAELQHQASLGAKAFADAQAKADDAILEKAIDEGRIPVGRKGHYEALMKADRADTTDLLTKRLAPGAAVPLIEVGHASDTTPAATVAENPRYKEFTKGLV